LQTSPKSAYHFPAGQSHGFPALNNDNNHIIFNLEHTARESLLDEISDISTMDDMKYYPLIKNVLTEIKNQMIQAMQDEAYYSDLKTHLEKKPEYQKQFKKWKKGKYVDRDLWGFRDEYFKVFCKEILPLFYQDLERFLFTHPDLSAPDAYREYYTQTTTFNIIGEDLTTQAIRRYYEYRIDREHEEKVELEGDE
jgi:hypothetical protein